jgi:hypothetical protein
MRLQLELQVWPTAPIELSIHKLLATRDCLYQYRFHDRKHVLYWPASKTEARWCRMIVSLNHRRLKQESLCIHQARVVLSLMDAGVFSDELLESCRDQASVIQFVRRMREVVHA